MARPVTLVKASAVGAAANAQGVQVFANVANQFTSIFVATTPKSRFYTYLNGQAFILKLAKADGVEISAVSTLVPAYLAPTMRLPKEYGTPALYAAWRNTPIDGGATAAPTQYNVETSAKRLLRFESGQNLTLPQDWQFHLLLSSPDVVDWTHANTTIELMVDESAVATQVAGA